MVIFIFNIYIYIYNIASEDQNLKNKNKRWERNDLNKFLKKDYDDNLVNKKEASLFMDEEDLEYGFFF